MDNFCDLGTKAYCDLKRISNFCSACNCVSKQSTRVKIIHLTKAAMRPIVGLAARKLVPIEGR